MRRSISEILSGITGSTKISNLVTQAQQLEGDEQVFRSELPLELKSFISFVSYHNGIITAIAPNAVLATQLRMHQQSFLQQLRRHETFRYVYQIKVKVRPIIKPQNKNKNTPKVSGKTAFLLAQEAKLCDDQDIATVLAALSRHKK